MTTSNALARISPLSLPRAITLRTPLLYRPYATHSSLTGSTSPSSRRKPITPFNDDGRIHWGDLSPSEKVARTTQQTFNLGLVIIGVLATGAVATYLYLDVLSPDSSTAHFNRAANRVRDDAQCAALLGDKVEFRNTLEAQHSRTFGAAGRRRAPTTVERDRFGTEWMWMRFFAVGERATGEVRVQMTRRPGEKEWSMHKLWVDVRGAKRVVLEDAEAAKMEGRKVPGKMFGVRWWTLGMQNESQSSAPDIKEQQSGGFEGKEDNAGEASEGVRGEDSQY
ncbi:TIM21-domain-containing protein [Viridothelium virens]|uniref:Mitochondrial import inner membrane translocase subunit Tim21 n=1 Tax=Viridothelium virens TaxID=1048519 RepID=A0A6A6HFV9_VIRVR|nr:TIM21-domain-containing protein [Viridothelium virens]